MERKNQNNQNQGIIIQTPKYWENKEFQPLVEAETAFGHKVKIPKNLLDIWEMRERQKPYILPDLERAKADGWFAPVLTRRKMVQQDIKRVYYEQYKA